METPKLRWKRCSAEPFLTPQAESSAADAVTTPDVLIRHGKLFLYVGAISAGHERLLSTSMPVEWLHASSLDSWMNAAEIAVDVGPALFDSLHVFDPASIVLDSKVLLYYSAVGPDGDALGMAVSDDGIHFDKLESPVMVGRAPEIVWFDGHLHLFYVRETKPGGYAIYSSKSPDGEDFSQAAAEVVLLPDTAPAWDSFEVTTPRIFQRDNMFYMLYAGQGDPAYKDIPHAFGLARSKDLKTWERFPGNPVFNVGAGGAWDDGAIWFGTVFPWRERLYLIYEGGTAEAVQEDGPALTQVGLAYIDVDVFDLNIASWLSE